MRIIRHHENWWWELFLSVNMPSFSFHSQSAIKNNGSKTKSARKQKLPYVGGNGADQYLWYEDITQMSCRHVSSRIELLEIISKNVQQCFCYIVTQLQKASTYFILSARRDRWERWLDKSALAAFEHINELVWVIVLFSKCGHESDSAQDATAEPQYFPSPTYSVWFIITGTIKVLGFFNISLLLFTVLSC